MLCSTDSQPYERTRSNSRLLAVICGVEYVLLPAFWRGRKILTTVLL